MNKIYKVLILWFIINATYVAIWSLLIPHFPADWLIAAITGSLCGYLSMNLLMKYIQ